MSALTHMATVRKLLNGPSFCCDFEFLGVTYTAHYDEEGTFYPGNREEPEERPTAVLVEIEIGDVLIDAHDGPFCTDFIDAATEACQAHLEDK